MKLRDFFIASAALMLTLSPFNGIAQDSETIQTETLLHGCVIDADGWSWQYTQYGFYQFAPSADLNVELVKADNTMSAKNGIYADGKYYFSTSYEMVGELLYMYWYCYDAGTLTQLSSDYFSYPDKEDLMTSACTYDPVTKQGYAVSLDAGGIVFFNSVDLESGTLTPIATGMPVQLLAMAANSVGQLYGVGSDGKLYSVEKSTGGLTEIGATGVQPEGDQSMAFSMMDGALYWCAYRQDGTSGLYEIDLQTGAATLIGDMPENQRIVGLYVTDPDVLPGAPATVTDLEATFENGNLDGTIQCTVPSATFDGNPLSGTLTVRLQIDQSAPEEMQYEAGSRFSVSKSLTQGEHVITVTVGNDVGFSAPATVSLYAGNDAPTGVSNLKFTAEGREASLSWEAPVETLHGGYLDAEGLNYRIVRNPGSVEVATGYKGTSFTETLPEALASYSYTVTAFVDDIEGASVESEKIICGDAIGVPYYETFDTAESLDLFTSFSEDAEGNLWEWDSYESAVKYNYDYYLQGAAWLFTPPIKLDTDCEYRLSFDVKTSSSYKENLKVTFGQTNTVDGQTTLLDLNQYTSADGAYETHTVSIKPAADGNYYIGFNAYSDPNMYYICVDNISIVPGASMQGPGGVTDLTAVAGPEGALSVNLSFNAPTKKYNGEQLGSLSEIRIYKGDEAEAAHVFENPEMGSRLEWTDENASHGMNTYRIVGYNDEAGEGETVTARVYAGEDVPTAVRNLRIVGDATTATLSWEAPEAGQQGGYVDKEALTYRIMRYDELTVGYYEIGTTKEFFYTDESPVLDADMRQTQVKYIVVPVSENMGVGEQTEGKVIVGEAYGLPFNESFANSAAQNDVWMTEVISGEQSWALALDMDIDPVASQDGDNGVAHFYNLDGGTTEGMLQSPVITLEGSDSPLLTFWMYRSAVQYEGDYYLGTMAAAGGNGFVQIGGRIDTYDGETESGWKRYAVSLADYAGEDYFQFAFLGYAYSWDERILVDNVSVAELADCAFLAVDDLAGSQADNDVTLEWTAPDVPDGLTLMGYNIYRDGEKIGSVDASVPGYVDESPEEGTYAYAVSAVYDAGESGLSNAVDVTVVYAGLESLAAGASVRSEGGCIVVEGAEGADVGVYSANGLLIYAGVNADATVRIPVSGGVYVVDVDGQITKVIVK